MNKKVAYILVIILSLLVLSLVSIMCVAIRNGGSLLWNGAYNDIIKNESYSLEDIENISLNLKSSDVEFFESDNNELKVIQYGNSNATEFTGTVNNKSIKIIDSRNSFMFFNFGHNSRYEVYLPKNYSGNLVVETISGEISLNNFVLNLKAMEIKSVSGDIRLNSKFTANETNVKTVSGEIIINQINSDKVALETTSGDIEIDSIISNNLNISTVSGEVTLDSISNMVKINTTSGDVTVKNLTITDDSKISTISGEIEIGMNEDSDCRIKTDTVSGDTDIRDNNYKDGQYEFKLSTTSGDIEID